MLPRLPSLHSGQLTGIMCNITRGATFIFSLDFSIFMNFSDVEQIASKARADFEAQKIDEDELKQLY